MNFHYLPVGELQVLKFIISTASAGRSRKFNSIYHSSIVCMVSSSRQDLFVFKKKKSSTLVNVLTIFKFVLLKSKMHGNVTILKSKKQAIKQ